MQACPYRQALLGACTQLPPRLKRCNENSRVKKLNTRGLKLKALRGKCSPLDTLVVVLRFFVQAGMTWINLWIIFYSSLFHMEKNVT